MTIRRLTWCATVIGSVAGCDAAGRQSDADWTSEFALEAEDLASAGQNPWFILEPGYVLEFEGGGDRLVITVLPETRVIEGVETRVVEERESVDGELVEVSRNFFAIDRVTCSVYYFGEEVDIFRDGVIVGHEGAWLAGVQGARAGMIMPGTALLGARHYQEIAPGVAMDRAEIVSLSDSVTTPAGRFGNVLRVWETTPLEPGQREAKYYARGVGLLRDGDMLLVRYGFKPQ